VSWTSIGCFGLVGLSGIAVNQLLMWGLVEAGHVNYLVAAVLASAGSTTSNFVLTEAWVFRSRSRPGIGRRYLGFVALTAATTPVRLPILFVLTSALGIHYLLSNLVALGSVFGGRYLVSSLLIWGKAPHPDPPPQAGKEIQSARYGYDIDGLIRLASDFRLPELEFFRSPHPERLKRSPGTNVSNARVALKCNSRGATPRAPLAWADGPAPQAGEGRPADLIVRRGVVGGIWPQRGKSISADERHLVWREQTGGLGGNFRIDFGPPVCITVAPLLGMSPHVVYTNLVEPILRFLLVQQNRMLLHAATVTIDGQSITLSAKTDTGKTGTILRLLQAHGGEFYADDMVIVDGDGVLSRYPKPLTISAHTVRSTPSHRLTVRSRLALPLQSRLHSRQGRTAGKWLGKRNLPIMSMNAIVQVLCPPPKYVITDLVDCRIGLTTRLQHLFIIDRGERAAVSQVGVKTGAEELAINTDDAYGFPPYASLAPYLKIGGIGCDELAQREQQILTRALDGVLTRRIVVQDYSWAAVIERHVGLGAAPLLEPDAVLDPLVAT
jgi:putative flippase GtrA